MLAIDRTMAVPSDPEISGSDQSSDEEFIMLAMPPEFVPGHLEDLEDALMFPDFPCAYQPYASDYNSSDKTEGDHSNKRNKTHVSSSDQSDNHCHDADGNDIYNNDYVILQKQEMDTFPDFHLYIVQSKFEDNYRRVVEGSGKPVERKEEQEQAHKEYKTSQWKPPEDLPSGCSLDGVPMFASRDPELGAANEQSSKEQISDIENLPLSPAVVERVELESHPRFCTCFCFPCFPLLSLVFPTSVLALLVLSFLRRQS